MFKALQAWFITNFCYTLVVPEYKGFHVTMSLDEYWHWRMQYPVECKVYTTCPKFKLGKWKLFVGAQIW